MSDRLDGSSNIRGSRGRDLRRLKDEFFSLAAHEIRTPITVIKAQAQLAERFHAQGKLRGELMEKALRTFVQESDRLARICTDLLDVARIDSGCFELYPSCFDLSVIAREIAAKYSARSKEHRLVFEDSETYFVCADRERTQHILGNILNNAIRYSPYGGLIRITIQKLQRHVRVFVRDEGIGIPSDRIKHIFRRYYQAHQSGLRGPSGLGLGLYLCRESLRRMGGTIRVSSEGAGRGSEFSFTLPKPDREIGREGGLDVTE